jgi:hypothetical protein
MFFLNRRRPLIPMAATCGSEWLPDQVLELIRKRGCSVEDERKMGESLGYFHFLLKISAQKFASSVNF